MPSDATPISPPRRDLFQGLGQRVQQARKSKGLSRKALSEVSGVSPRYLAQLEGGQGNISIALLDRVARAVGVSMGALIDGEGDVQRLFAQADAETQARVLTLLRGKAPVARTGRICLIGLRGAGKSTLGRALATSSGLPFVELNQRIEAEAGMPLAEIMALYGADGYRQLEAQALQSTLAATGPFVLAVAGGIVSEPETFEILRQGCHTIWLRASAQEHMDRVRAQGDTRPMSGNPEAMVQLERLLQRRTPLYAMADAELETSGKTVAQSLDDLTRLVQDRAFLTR